jgi:type I protein arginine methyltransferase
MELVYHCVLCMHADIHTNALPYYYYCHTHLQTVFYLRDAVEVNSGETVSGNFDVRPNAKNQRDLDIALKLNFERSSGSLQLKQDYRLR